MKKVTHDATGADFYVGCTDCSDTEPGYGIDPSSPYCTIMRALEEVEEGAGAVIRVLPGTYFEQVKIKKSGTAESPLILEAGESDTVRVDGTGLMGHWDGMSWNCVLGVSGASNVIVRGLVIQNALDHRYREPIQEGTPIGYGVVVCGSQEVTLDNLLVRETDHGGIILEGGSSNIRLTGCEVTATNRLEEDWIAGSAHEAVTVSGCTDYMVEDNYVHDVYEEGIDIKDGSHDGIVRRNIVERTGAVGIYLNNSWNSDVYDNDVIDVGHYRDPASDSGEGIVLTTGDGALGEMKVNHNRIFRNLIRGSSRQGIAMHNRTSSESEIAGNLIFNNTVFGCGWATNGGCSLYLAASEIASDNHIFNNIFSSSHSYRDEVCGKTDGVEGYNNLYFNTYGYPPVEEIDPWYPSNSVSGDPMFTDPDSGDFMPGAGSPAIDMGKCISGGSFSGNGIDAGAIELDDGGGSSRCRSIQASFLINAFSDAIV